MIAYNSKPGETALDDLSGLKLKIPGVTRGVVDEAEAENIRKAMVGYHTRRKRLAFDTVLFRRLHRDMFCDVWRWAGEFRTTQTKTRANLGAPPAQILQDLIILEKDLVHWPKDLESGARLHHRAVQIHPFPNGNGRWARLLADLWLRQESGIVMRWPVGLNAESDIRGAYIAALKAADGMDYGPLVGVYEGCAL